MRRQWKALRGTDFFIFDQFPKEMSNKQNILVKKMKEAPDECKRAWIVSDTHYVDGKPVDGLRRGRLSVVSWNVLGLTMEKQQSLDFVNIISICDICFLF